MISYEAQIKVGNDFVSVRASNNFSPYRFTEETQASNVLDRYYPELPDTQKRVKEVSLPANINLWWMK